MDRIGRWFDDRPRARRWAAAWTGLLTVQLLASWLPGTTPLWSNALGLFLLVVIAASLCVVAALVVLTSAVRQGLAELGLLGAFAFAVSALPLVHGITTPGIWYGPNAATMSSVFWALPIASLAAVPLIAPGSRWSRRLQRRWRPLVTGHVAGVAGLCVALLVRPSLLPFPAMSSPAAIAASAASVAVCFALSVRQLRLSWIARSAKPFTVSIGFALVGVSSLVWVGRAPFTAGFWLAHALDIAGVFGIAIGATIAYRQHRDLRAILTPLTVHTPLAAFELGLDPIVHRFVASLESKDPITRDHVVRSAGLAMAVGERLGLHANDLHVLGLGALLHDVGKLAVPATILGKPDRLTDAEFAVMKHHVIAGEQLVRGSRALEAIAPIVRGHHERFDGNGYPDRLSGPDISFLARIVSVCDAFDAMANTRQYRVGMGVERAIAILREHSGSQWDPVVVEAFVELIQTATPDLGRLEHVGRLGGAELPEFADCGCLDALPPQVAQLA